MLANQLHCSSNLPNALMKKSCWMSNMTLVHSSNGSLSVPGDTIFMDNVKIEYTQYLLFEFYHTQRSCRFYLISVGKHSIPLIRIKEHCDICIVEKFADFMLFQTSFSHSRILFWKSVCATNSDNIHMQKEILACTTLCSLTLLVPVQLL